MRRMIFFGGGLLILLMLGGFGKNGWAEERYTVKPGDSLYRISKSYGVAIEELKKVNRLRQDLLRPNQVLVIPVELPAPRTEKDLEISLEMESKERRVAALQRSRSTPQPEAKEETLGEEGSEEKVQASEVEHPHPSEPMRKPNRIAERSLFVRVVKTFLGVPYRLGGSTLRGIDCSAFVKKIYEIFDISLPRTAHEQLRSGRPVEREELEQGDLVFFKTHRAQRTHVGIYIGNGEFIHASSRNREVKVDRLNAPYFNKRFIGGVRVMEWERES